jgi:hypothetical protein
MKRVAAEQCFDILTVNHLLHKLEEDYADLKANRTSSRHALNCAMTAWHVKDWLWAQLFKGDRQTVQSMYAVFGTNSARLYNVDLKTNRGTWDTKFSVAAFDIQAGALVGKSPAKVQAVAEQIREQYLSCVLSDAVLQSAISKQTGGTVQTKYRWTAFKTVVEPIIDGTVLEPRFFDITFRRKLFDQAAICKICGNQIHVFDDSTVDHIHPYSKRGKTLPENGQLAHRSCNARKNAFLPGNPTA